jgi:hypothetical protein
MDQTNLVPISNTARHPLNLLPDQPRRQPLHRYLPSPASLNPQFSPLNQHPKWPYFVVDLNELILKHSPHLRDSYRELLKRADLL